MLLMLLQWHVIVMCPPHYLLSNALLCDRIVIAIALIKGNCKLGIGVTGQPIMILFAAKRAQAITFHFHQRSLCTNLQSGPTDCLWWNLTKNINGLYI